MSNLIHNPGMVTTPRKPRPPFLDNAWKSYSCPGPRTCVAVTVVRSRNTRRAQRNKIVRLFVDTVFSCQYRSDDPAAVPVVTFKGNRIHIGQSVGDGKEIFMVMPQLNWNAPQK